MSATLSLIAENQSTLDSRSDFSLFARSRSYRPNPPIADGSMRSLKMDMRLGRAAVPLDIVSRNALELSLEHSSPSVLGSGFDFTRCQGTVVWNIRTFSRSLFFAPVLRFRISGGTSSGTLPPQRAFIVDSRASGYAPFGVLRGSSVRELGGDRFFMINIEHNFRSVPFLVLNIPSLYRNGIELIIHGSAAQSWNGSTSTSGGWYSEAGFGVSRILDLLRADLTYRFNEPERLFFTVSVATLF